MTQRQIIALGGGGFSVEPENPALELYILRQAQTATPRVGFIPTASGDSDRYVDDLVVLDCLGFLKGSCCPHFDGEVERRPS